MPRYRAPENPTPFARVLLDYMWSQRPPLSAGQLAVKLGNISRQTVHNWLYLNNVPSIGNALDALDRLGIPLERLLQAYEEEAAAAVAPDQTGTQTTTTTTVPATATATTTSTRREHQQPPLDVWVATIERTERAMRELGMDEQTIAAVITRIQEQQRGVRPYQRHIEAEHTAPDTSPQPRVEPQTPRKMPAPSGPRSGKRRSGSENGSNGNGHANANADRTDEQ